ncbi:hypothetical protein RHGRI_025387 [Rhododendron griersonianum]|uniref:Major facilitator superfamily (MFS) profile domain-containing protein n=1 Tax=Rhododendron griersonianum TaxID=479676 RepID=A0AAV6IP15_9ERIC|nr:hypothetical protein RHGRI_025387 [Rhododendron griersonianum]
MSSRLWIRRPYYRSESTVSMAVAGAIVGAAVGGWLNDRYGRRTTILIADFLFFIGAVIMAAAPNPSLLIVGRVFVSLGVGMASMTSPLYISEASPAKIRGSSVSTNGFLITGGQFLSYLVNLAFTKAPGTWRWMLGVAGIPSLVQFILMLLLPESPRWLYRKGREEEAKTILRKIYPAEDVEAEIQALNPTIVQLAGFASNQTALLLSLVTAGLNALGSIVSIYFIDRTGRKKPLVFSLRGVIISLGVLSAVFHETTTHSPAVSAAETASFGGYMCPDYSSAGSSGGNWDCMKCLKASSPDCGFCASSTNKSFLSLTQAIGTSWTFLMFGVISVVALFFVLIFVPETKGFPIEEIEKMLEMRGLQLKFWKKRGDSELKKNQNV